jgi:general secretion pathway protein J
MTRLRRPSRLPRARGFTLLELLVAMAIFGIIGAMALGGLNAVISQSTQARVQMDRLIALQRTLRLISSDLAGLAPRWVRDELGTQWEPPLVTDGRGIFLLRLSRGGWGNPAGLPHRGTLQRVQYRLDDGKLTREYWPVMDHVLGQEPRAEELLTGVASLKFLYLDDQGQWQPEWPPLQKSAAPAGSRPRAVKVQLELDDWGQIERLVELVQ